MTDLLIRNARVRGQADLVDIAIAKGLIEAVAPRQGGSARETIVPRPSGSWGISTLIGFGSTCMIW